MTIQSAPLLRLLRSAVGLMLTDLGQQLTDRGWLDTRTAWIFVIGRLDMGPPTINDLAHHLDVSKQAASKTIESMERYGLVRLLSFPGDGRKRVVELTDDGQRFRKDVLDILDRIEQSWTTSIGEDGVRALREHLESVLATHDDGALPPP